MKKMPNLLKWLEQIGDESVKDKDAIIALNNLYARITGEKVDLRPRYGLELIDDFFEIRITVNAFLQRAASIANSKAYDPQVRILRMARIRMMPRGSQRLRFAFRLRAVVASMKPAESQLDICEPVGTEEEPLTPDFCVSYALWLMARDIPVEKWRRYTLIRCDRVGCDKGLTHPAVGARASKRSRGDTSASFKPVAIVRPKSRRAWFFDRRWVRRSGPRKYCSHDCQVRRNA